jgi:hypothetical protein
MATPPFVILDFQTVQVQIQVAPITVEGFEEHLKREGERIRATVGGVATGAFVIIDGSVALMPPAAARKMQAEWIAEHGELLRVITRGLCFVLPNPLLRAFIGTVFHIVPPPAPWKTQATLEDAVTWAMGQAEALGLPIDERLLERGVDAITEARIRAVRGEDTTAPPLYPPGAGDDGR